jgi:non-ribosomal peptide synthetase component F
MGLTPVPATAAAAERQPIDPASATIRNLLTETRRYPALPAFAAQANVDATWWDRAAADPIAFWAEQAERLDWAEPWHTDHTWQPARADADGVLSVPRAEWFVGGTLNVAVNCVDRHVAAGKGDKVAFHFEGEPGDRRTITYAELEREVNRAANALTELGIVPGDRVVLYLPVIPETIVITLAIARLGAVHSLVFGGFSAEALRFRVEDTGAKLLVTTDGQFRRGQAVPVKAAADEAVAGVDSIEHVLVVRRTGDLTPDIPFTPGRDVWWHDTVDRASPVHEPAFFDAETPLFIIYTSGTTGTPKGLVHTSGGYLTHASWSHWAVFDAKDDDVHWCTADLAWVTAHSYVHYGPLSNGTTSVIYEGTPDTPHPGRHFEIIERYGVTTYYTAPTLIRTFMTWFPEGVPSEFDLSSIRLLGSVGEAINPAAWVWFRENIGDRRRRDGAAAGRQHAQARFGPARPARPDDARRRRPRPARAVRLRRLPGDRGHLARHGAHGLGQPRALPRLLLGAVRRAGLLLLRRRREIRRRRRHLAARPRRRRDQRVRAPPVDDRNRVGAGGASAGRRGRRRRRDGCENRRGHRGVRDPGDGAGAASRRQLRRARWFRWLRWLRRARWFRWLRRTR